MAMQNSREKQKLDRSLVSPQTSQGADSSAAASYKTPQTRQFISRRLLRTDTLTGLALKYGITIPVLKKENKLWNNDHLFLRESLLIPLTAENEKLLDENDTIIVCDGCSSNLPSPSTHLSHLPNGELTDSSQSFRPSSSLDGDISSNGASASSSSISKLPQATSKDFFAKYDTSIARLKGDVAKMERNAANLEGLIDANPLALPPRKGSNSSRRDSNTSTISASERRGRYVVDGDGSSSPVLLIRSWTNSRHVKTTIDNLQQVNDDIFEL